jgi:two-component system, NarL family, sensor histidine kinase UhpB
MPDPDRARGYVPLTYKLAGLNAGVLLAAVIVTLLVLDPHRTTTVELDEAIVLVLALTLVAAINFYFLRRVIGPITALTELARRVDLSNPGTRMPLASGASEAHELSVTFNQMLDRLESERREATGRVLAGQETERLRIAQELHDQIGQELTTVLLGLARVHALTTSDTRPVVEEVQDAVRASLQDVRRIALELRPEALDELGLLSALAVLCARLAERGVLRVEQRINPDLPALTPDQELVIYRVAQESLTNVVRHSGAQDALLTFDRVGEELVLEVSDHGNGLPDGVVSGTGIRGMQERAALIGGRLELSSPTGGGCRVRLSIATETPAAGSRVGARDDASHDPDPSRG